jgi:hypothetical protein
MFIDSVMDLFQNRASDSHLWTYFYKSREFNQCCNLTVLTNKPISEISLNSGDKNIKMYIYLTTWYLAYKTIYKLRKLKT